MTRFGAAISPHLGEVRLRDIALQVGNQDAFVVRVLDRDGIEQRFELRFTKKWGGGWQRQLECPHCRGPAVVLRIFAQGALCARCRPESTAHHGNKNRRTWQSEGALADKITRTVMRDSASAVAAPSAQQLASQLKRNGVLRAIKTLDLAESLVRSIDNAGILDGHVAARGGGRSKRSG